MAIDTELEQSAAQLLAAAHAHFNVMRRRGISGGCIWVTDVDGAMVVFTRGEFRDRLLHNIETRFDAEKAYSFGAAALSGTIG